MSFASLHTCACRRVIVASICALSCWRASISRSRLLCKRERRSSRQPACTCTGAFFPSLIHAGGDCELDFSTPHSWHILGAPHRMSLVVWHSLQINLTADGAASRGGGGDAEFWKGLRESSQDIAQIAYSCSEGSDKKSSSIPQRCMPMHNGQIVCRLLFHYFLRRSLYDRHCL